MPMGLVANLLDKDGDRGCKGADEWWPLGVQGALSPEQRADGLGMSVGGNRSRRVAGDE